MKAKENHRARLLAVNKEAAKYYYYQLRSKKGEVGYRYLSERKLSEETMNKFGLGYASDGLVRYLREKGYEDKLIIEAGLAGFNEKRGIYDSFWNRVMFPIQDINHRVIGFGGRVMGKGEPKYLNSPETPVFDKRRNLYGFNFARTARTGNIILCEGYMDVISMHQAGFTQAVASLGTAFTSEQALLLKRYTDKVLLAYDSDGAGVKAALRGIGILKQAGLSAADRPVIAAALAKRDATGAPAAAIELPDGSIVTGKTSNLLGASSAMLMNALKALAGIDDSLKLIAPAIIEPIQRLKVDCLGNHNPRLHTDEVLIALSVCAECAIAQLGKLRGCEAHSTVILSQVDENLLKKLGVHLTYEPVYQTKKLHHK